jgi:hypothetical protein
MPIKRRRLFLECQSAQETSPLIRSLVSLAHVEKPNSLDLGCRHEKPNSLDLSCRHEQPNSLEPIFMTAALLLARDVPITAHFPRCVVSDALGRR